METEDGGNGYGEGENCLICYLGNIILVLDGRKDEKVEYWLKHVKSFGADSPVLVVINKIDQNSPFDVNRLFLLKKYPNIKGFFRLSCATGEGIDSFSKNLVQELAKVEFIGTIWPRSWFDVKIRLEKMKKDFIRYHEYKTICRRENIDDKIAQDILLEFLNDLGVVLHFKDFRLKETHVLEPEWVTTAVYKIINSREVAAAKGLLKLSSLKKILKQESRNDYYYPPDKYGYIVELMQKFELCYEIDRETILIPDLLEVQEPSFEFDTASALKFMVEYDFLPRSVMPRFIVKMHKDIKEDLQWRTGVVLEDKAFGCTAVVKADNEEKKIHIHVQGSETQRRDYFSILRKALRDINNSFEKLDAVERVPLPDDNNISVTYKELVGLERMGIDKYNSGELGKTYSIAQLLAGIEKIEERKNLDSIVFKNIVNPHIEVSSRQYVRASQSNVQEVAFDINSDLPAIRNDFAELRELLTAVLVKEETVPPALAGDLKEIMDNLDEVTPGSADEKVSKPLNKLGRFLRKFGDEKSDYSKILIGVKKGMETVGKVARTYNKFAQWVPGLPVIPDVLLKTQEKEVKQK